MKFAFLLFVLAVSGCSRVDIYQPQTQAGPSGGPATQARVVEIDRLLSAPLTGQQGDADQRATLRAERAALVGGNPQRPNVVVNNSVNYRANQQQQSRQQRQENQVPAVTVARDSRADEHGNLSFLEQMTPTEREHYYKARQIENPQSVYAAPVYYGPRR